jgi:hypothetical protein
MQRFLILVLLAVVVLSACTAKSNDQLVTDEGQSSVVTVYKSPT